MNILTDLHVAISLAAIIFGFIAVGGFLAGQNLIVWSALFLWTTIATSVTGFIFFPLHPFRPAHTVGILSLIVLALAASALYICHLAGAARKTFLICSIISLYFNVFVCVVQTFEKVPSLKAITPTQTEPPFVIAQVVVLILFIVLGVQAVKSSPAIVCR
jgi:hypothetical protein